MNDFVEQCRREWARLGVSDAVANEMAADLSADLEEAERDGVAAEEVLGVGAFDAPAFAHSWAAERGVIPPTPPAPSRPNKPPGERRWGSVALGGAVALGVAGVLLAIVAASQLALRRVAGAVPAPLRLPLRSPILPPDIARRFTIPKPMVLATHARIDPAAFVLLVMLMLVAAFTGGALGAALWSRRPRSRA